MILALTLTTDTLIAILATAVVSGLVPAVLLVIKIINDREARIAARLNDVAEQAAETNLRSRTNRGNVEELWQERDELRKDIAALRRSLQNHSQLLKTTKPETS